MLLFVCFCCAAWQLCSSPMLFSQKIQVKLSLKRWDTGKIDVVDLPLGKASRRPKRGTKKQLSLFDYDYLLSISKCERVCARDIWVHPLWRLRWFSAMWSSHAPPKTEPTTCWLCSSQYGVRYANRWFFLDLLWSSRFLPPLLGTGSHLRPPVRFFHWGRVGDSWDGASKNQTVWQSGYPVPVRLDGTTEEKLLQSSSVNSL